jgi:hypothetical protein
MSAFVKCTTDEKIPVSINMNHVALVRPYRSDRGFSGSEVVFSSGNPTSIIVEQTQDQLVAEFRTDGSQTQ